MSLESLNDLTSWPAHRNQKGIEKQNYEFRYSTNRNSWFWLVPARRDGTETKKMRICGSWRQLFPRNTSFDDNLSLILAQSNK